nr:hypothetical protein [Brucella intermedia]
MNDPTERIVAVAVYHGATISLPPPARHDTILKSMLFVMGFEDALVPHDKQGFLTSTGRFVNRVEGYHIAYRAKQLIANTAGRPELYSEDLW